MPSSGHLKEMDIAGESVDVGMPRFRLPKGSHQSVAGLVTPKSAVTVTGKAHDGKISSALNVLCIPSLKTAKEVLKTPLPFAMLSLTYSHTNILLSALRGRVSYVRSEVTLASSQLLVPAAEEAGGTAGYKCHLLPPK